MDAIVGSVHQKVTLRSIRRDLMRSSIGRTLVVAGLAGALALTPITPASAATFYEHSNYGGQAYWNEWPCDPYRADMPQWFWDKASSWQNAGTAATALNYSGSGGVFYSLWYMPPLTQSSYVGNANNDKADSQQNWC